MRPLPVALSTLLVLLTGGVPAMAGSPERAIRRSDVVFMYDDPKVYEAYGCTVLGWGGWPAREHIRQAHAKGVRRFSCSVGFLTEFKRVIDFSADFLDAACRNFAGETFIVPWLWDHHHRHKGQRAWWWCTNSPLYRKYLESRLVEVMKAEPDGLHIDDYRGTSGCVTWLSGCFCRHCMAAFRGYLAKHVPRESLTKLGVGDLDAFDYRQFLLGRGVTAETYKKQRGRLPLAAEFHHFQIMAANDFVAAYHRRAEELRGRPLGLSVNSGLNSPHALVAAPLLSNFCCEVHHNAATRRCATHPVAIYKLADGLGRPVASTASGQDWAFVMEHKLPGLVRTWTALSYAFGHNLMAPHRQWCYTKEKGTHWYAGPTEEYGWLYRFVRDQARLLDGYDTVAPAAIVYGNLAHRKGRGRIQAICTSLAAANVPFTVVVAGDDWLPDYRITRAQLRPFKAVIAPKTLELDPKQQAVLEAVAADGRLVTWPDRKRLDSLLPAPVALEGTTHVWAVPRAAKDRPAVVHLLNRQYDAGKDAMVPQKGFVLRLRRDLFGGRTFACATLHAPRAEPTVLDLSSDATHTRITIPSLDLWGILELVK